MPSTTSKTSFNALGFFNRNGSVLADLVHGIRNDFTDFVIPVGRDGCNLANFLTIGNLLAITKQLFNTSFDSLVDCRASE